MTHLAIQTEADFQQAVIEYAQLAGCLVAHFRPARTERGRRTPVAADGAGFPDLVLVRDRLVFAELNQLMWLEELERAGVEAYLWRPEDWPTIEQALGR